MIKRFIKSILGLGDKAEADQARKTTRSAKPKKRGDGKKSDKTHLPEIYQYAQHQINIKLASPNAIRVTDTLQQAGFQAFIVGGAVRDLLLGIKPKDFDVATNATPQQVQQLFRRARLIGRRFQIVHVQFGHEIIETSTFRALTTDSAPTDEHGRVLRDNIFGEQHEDATRRDFSVNALYYDPATQTVHDYHHGVADLRAKTLRMIGDPATRYREDPVRMLRAVRFAAKLGFQIDPATRQPIVELAELLSNVPAARLFDEMLKLFYSGSALACLKQLREEGLHHGVLPLLDTVLEQPLGEKFVDMALANTDARIKAEKSVSPGFLFASLLWHQVLEQWKALEAGGEHSIPALHHAMNAVLDTQTEKLAINRRFTGDMKDIWLMQPRFEKRSGRMPYRLMENPRFRAGYDFLLLRCQSGEMDEALGQWWTDFIDADAAGREELIQSSSRKNKADDTKPKRKRRKPRKAGEEISTSTPPIQP